MSEGVAADLVWLYGETTRLGLNNGSSGNVSCRMGESLLITPTGAAADGLTPADMVSVALSGPPVPGTKPSSEWAMHAAVYQACPDAGWVVHTHADACTALACLNQALPPFHYTVLGFGGREVPCAPYVTFGTPALAEAVRQTIAGLSACLLANHGMICHGATAPAALANAVRLETLARQYLLARSAGQPRLLSDSELAEARARYATYGKPV